MMQRQAEANELNRSINTREGLYSLDNDGEIRYRKHSNSTKRKMDVLRQAAQMTALRRYERTQDSTDFDPTPYLMAGQQLMNNQVNPGYGRQFYNQQYNQ